MITEPLIFIGTGSFGLLSLGELSKSADIRLVVCQPPKISAESSSPIYNRAKELGLRILTPNQIFEASEIFNKISPATIIVADYGQIIPESILKIPKRGCLNIHPSLLPKHRGPTPIVSAILNGDSETGVTIIKMDSKMDHGPIVAQKSYRLQGTEMALELNKILGGLAADLLMNVLPQYLNGDISLREQDHNTATYHHLLKRSDGLIEDKEFADAILRKHRAYFPWPGIWFKKKNGKKEIIIKLIDIESATKPSSVPSGSFFLSEGCLYLAAAAGSIKINKLQVEGKSILGSTQFINGYSNLIYRSYVAKSRPDNLK